MPESDSTTRKSKHKPTHLLEAISADPYISRQAVLETPSGLRDTVLRLHHQQYEKHNLIFISALLLCLAFIEVIRRELYSTLAGVSIVKLLDGLPRLEVNARKTGNTEDSRIPS